MTNILTILSVCHVVQGIIVGGVLAFLMANIIMNAVVKAITTTVNGWSTTTKCGQPGNGILLRAACARNLPAVNVVQEAAYWTTTVDSAGRRLSGLLPSQKPSRKSTSRLFLISFVPVILFFTERLYGKCFEAPSCGSEFYPVKSLSKQSEATFPRSLQWTCIRPNI
jgi:hypothetical protein